MVKNKTTCILANSAAHSPKTSLKLMWLIITYGALHRITIWQGKESFGNSTKLIENKRETMQFYRMKRWHFE